MEKVGDSRSSSSSSEPVSSTNNEIMKQRRLRVLKVEAEYSEICFEKIKGVLEKLKETGVIDTVFNSKNGTVTVLGYFDPEKLKMELKNEMGDAIKSITDPTESMNSGSDGTAMVMEYFDYQKFVKMFLENALFYRIPEMPVPILDNPRTEIINHSENQMEQQPNKSRRLWCWWCCSC